MRMTINEMLAEGFTHAWQGETGLLVLGAVTPCEKCGEPVEEANALNITDKNDEWHIRNTMANHQFPKYLSPRPLQPHYNEDGQVSDLCENCG